MHFTQFATVLLVLMIILSSCHMTLVPEEPSSEEEILSQEEVNEIFAKFVQNLDFDSLIDDMLQTHREIGDYGESIIAWVPEGPERDTLLAEFEMENQGNTGVADYLFALDTDNISNSAEMGDLLDEGSGRIAVPFYEKSDEATTEITFRTLAMNADADEGKAEVTIAMTFDEDYSHGFKDGSSLAFKKGSGIYVTFTGDYKYSGSGADNLSVTLASYSLSTVDPHYGDAFLSLPDYQVPGISLIVDGKSRKLEIENLSGRVEGSFKLDIRAMPLLALKTIITLENFSLPMRGNEVVHINGKLVDTYLLKDSSSRKITEGYAWLVPAFEQSLR